MKAKLKLWMMVAAALFSLPLRAQETPTTMGRISFGLRAGVNFYTVTGSDAAGNDLENNIRTGFHGGINAEVPLGASYYLQPGVLFSQKGAEFAQHDEELHVDYVEIPVNFLYKPALGSGRLLLGVGPYVGFGTGGKYEWANGTETDIRFENEVPANGSANNFYMRGLDIGTNFLAGYEFTNNFSFQVNGQLGMTNNYPEGSAATSDETKWKNIGFGLSLGYRFNR